MKKVENNFIAQLFVVIVTAFLVGVLCAIIYLSFTMGYNAIIFIKDFFFTLTLIL